MKYYWMVLALFVIALVPKFAAAQPFFGPGATSFSPEISVLFVGVKNDVQATVSADRKYVTLNMRPQHSQLLNFFTFTFQNPPLVPGALGFVGGVQFPETPVVGAAVAGAFGKVNAPVALAAGNGEKILTQRGMTPVALK